MDDSQTNQHQDSSMFAQDPTSFSLSTWGLGPLLAWPTRHPALLAFLGFSMVGHGLDVHSTHIAIANGASELNPRIAAILASHGTLGFIAFKAVLFALIYGLVAAITSLHPTGPRIAAAMLILGGIPAWLIAGSNYNEAGWLP